ncbi:MULTISPECIES: hypothetical protein [unclassified Bosea (in: a-proteobacteria)]|uniref:hypothetical protein n=1 Tax=unclassified Bosea (in: a-proteobacteria) TaxID=2653178 RepID=UPI000F7F183E|nr:MULTISPECIES: hypothetical protein [unclassified Bosea (in: a-proteobacteria)]
MAGEVAAALASLKAATDIIGGLDAARDLHKFSGDLIELQNKIISANVGISTLQDQVTTLKDQKRDLEDKLRDIENWHAEAQRYQLKDFGGESFAYALKPGMENGEPRHYLCANCMPKRQKSILQRITNDGFYQCHACSNGFQLGEKERLRVGRVTGGDDGGWMAR